MKILAAYEDKEFLRGRVSAGSVENVYTSGVMVVKLIVNAYEPVRFLSGRQMRD